MTILIICCVVSCVVSTAFAFRFSRTAMEAVQRSLETERRMLVASAPARKLEELPADLPYRTIAKPDMLMLEAVETEEEAGPFVVDWVPRVLDGGEISFNCRCPACDQHWFWKVDGVPKICSASKNSPLACKKVEGPHFHLACDGLDPKKPLIKLGCGFKWVMRAKAAEGSQSATTKVTELLKEAKAP